MTEYLTEHFTMICFLAIVFCAAWNNERKIKGLSERIADLEDRLNPSLWFRRKAICSSNCLSSPRGNLWRETRFSSSLPSDENWYRKPLMPWRMTSNVDESDGLTRTSMAKPFHYIFCGRLAHTHKFPRWGVCISTGGVVLRWSHCRICDIDSRPFWHLSHWFPHNKNTLTNLGVNVSG